VSPAAHTDSFYALQHWDARPGAPFHVVAASGELDLVAAPALRELLEQLAELGQVELIVDLSEVTFVDSTTIGVLTGRLRSLRAAGGSMTLVCSHSHVLRTIEVAGVRRYFDVYATLSEAFASKTVPS
jgi:anti-sigma B factor antagonist